MASSLQAVEPLSFLKLLAHQVRWKLVAALARSDYRVAELVALTTEPLNLVSYHLRRLRDLSIVQEHRSSADGRDVYYSLNLSHLRALYFAAGDTLHPSLGNRDEPFLFHDDEIATPIARVLFLCTHNSARSQMAEAILRQASKGQVEVYSAGNEPAGIHPYTYATMERRGISMDGHSSKSLDEFCDQAFDYVITVCDRVREACPTLPGDPDLIHWSFPDPLAVTGGEDRIRQAFDETATQLTTRISYLLGIILRQQGNNL